MSTTDARQTLIAELREHALVIGEVTLSSGAKADYYVDARRALLRPAGFLAAGELIAEAAHAIEMGSDAEDLGLTIHPHPTLSETVAFAAEAFEGTITDLYMPKKPKK